jgi:hypothetical protein
MTAGTLVTLQNPAAYLNTTAAGIQLPLKALELAKVRIKHILRSDPTITNDVVSAFSTYGAVAAVNSISPTTGLISLINIKGQQTTSATYTATTSSNIYGGGLGLIDNAVAANSYFPINWFNPATSTPSAVKYSLLSLYKELPQTFAVITSKAYMLALTNNSDTYTVGGPPFTAGYAALTFSIPQSGAGPNAPGDPIVYNYNNNTNITGGPNSCHPATLLANYAGGWQDSFAPALQSYVNYLAALAISDSAQTAATAGSASGTGYTLDLAMFGHYNNFAGATGDLIANYVPSIWIAFQCIYGLLTGSSCEAPVVDGVNTVAPWVGADAKNFMLSLPYLAANPSFHGIDTEDIATINGLYSTYNNLESNAPFPQLVGAPLGGLTPPFATYKDFFNVYSNLDITRAVTPYDYYTTFVTGGGALSGAFLANSLGSDAPPYTAPYTTQIFQSEPIMDMINKGIISFAQAFTDITAGSPHPYVTNPAFQMWGNKLPISILSTDVLYPNTQIGAHANTNGYPGGPLTSPTAWWSIMRSPMSGNVDEHTWVSTFATRGNWATLLAEGDVTFQELESLPMPTTGTGFYAPAGDTEANFLNHFGLAANLAAGSYAMTYEMIKAGIPLNSFCAVATATSEATPFPCNVAYPSLAISTANSVPNSMTHLACATSREVLELLESEHAYYWQSPYLLLADVMTAVCA